MSDSPKKHEPKRGRRPRGKRKTDQHPSDGFAGPEEQSSRSASENFASSDELSSPSLEDSSTREDNTHKGIREGDTTMGRKVRSPRAAKATTLTERQWEEDEADRKAQEFENLDPFLEPVQIPSFLNSTMVLSLLLLMFAFLGLVAYSYMLSTIATLWSLPALMFWPGLMLLLFFGGVLSWSLGQLLFLYRSLNHNRQISMVRISARQWSPRAQEKTLGAAKRELMSYVSTYPIRGSKVEKQWEVMGVNESRIEHLEKVQERLQESRPQSSASWIKEFEQTFVNELDTIAAQRVHYFSKWVAIKTTLSPNGLLDTCIVLYSNFRMMSELCRIYQVRTNRLGTMYMLLLIIFHAYVSVSVGDQLSDMGEDSTELMMDSLGNLGANVASQVMTRGAEAASQYAFTRRIGRKACAMLRPLASGKP